MQIGAGLPGARCSGCAAPGQCAAAVEGVLAGGPQLQRAVGRVGMCKRESTKELVQLLALLGLLPLRQLHPLMPLHLLHIY